MHDVFDLEKDIWEKEGIRVSFHNPGGVKVISMYSEKFKEPLDERFSLDDLFIRITTLLEEQCVLSVLSVDGKVFVFGKNYKVETDKGTSHKLH